MVGQGRAMDIVLTGRPVLAIEAMAIGLVERLAQPGAALDEAMTLARKLAELPQGAMRADRSSLLGQWSLGFDDALRAEHRGGVDVLDSGEAESGARRFSEGIGRHGE
jgi:enoyl-CoA hydratase